MGSSLKILVLLLLLLLVGCIDSSKGQVDEYGRYEPSADEKLEAQDRKDVAERAEHRYNRAKSPSKEKKAKSDHIISMAQEQDRMKSSYLKKKVRESGGILWRRMEKENSYSKPLMAS